MSAAAAETVAALLQALEEQLLQPATRANAEAIAALLTDDFREFGSSGRTYTKPEMIAALATEAPRELTMANFRCELVAPAVALVTYRSLSNLHAALRSSLWVLRDGRWQMLFHQGTRCPG